MCSTTEQEKSCAEYFLAAIDRTKRVESLVLSTQAAGEKSENFLCVAIKHMDLVGSTRDPRIFFKIIHQKDFSGRFHFFR